MEDSAYREGLYQLGMEAYETRCFREALKYWKEAAALGHIKSMVGGHNSSPRGIPSRIYNKAIISDGSRLATLIFCPNIRLIPTQNIKMFPIYDRLLRAASVINGCRNPASRVIVP